ncbi:MAG: hypothetical protein ACR2JO_05935, partial [Mycobacteriales bacterium]
LALDGSARSAEEAGGGEGYGEHARPEGVAATPPGATGHRPAPKHRDVQQVRADEPGKPGQVAEPAADGADR